MTASLDSAEKGKAAYVGRCFSSATFPQRQPRRVLNLVPPVAASLDAAHLPAGVLGGRVERVGSATAIFIARENLGLTLRGQPASDAPREGSESLEVVSFHVPNMEQANATSVAPPYVKERR